PALAMGRPRSTLCKDRRCCSVRSGGSKGLHRSRSPQFDHRSRNECRGVMNDETKGPAAQDRADQYTDDLNILELLEGKYPAIQRQGPATNLSAAALDYATRGLAVLPLRPIAKEPLTPHGVNDATTDAAVIRSWWQRWPAANVGIATGRATHLLVLDIDG